MGSVIDMNYDVDLSDSKEDFCIYPHGDDELF